MKIVILLVTGRQATASPSLDKAAKNIVSAATWPAPYRIGESVGYWGRYRGQVYKFFYGHRVAFSLDERKSNEQIFSK